MGDSSGQMDRKIISKAPSKKTAHPYEKLEKTPIWALVDRAIAALIKNKDIELTTRREYVVGYICKTLADDTSTKSLRKFK